MNSGKYIFAQVLEFVNQYEFDKCIKRYSCDLRVRNLNYWNQFAQLTSLNSFQKIFLCVKAYQ